MKRRLFCVAITVMMMFPMTSFAGSKFNKGKIDKVSEVPITEPLGPEGTVFDECGPPVNPWPALIPWKPFKLFDDFYYIGSKGVGSFVIDTRAGLILIDAGWGDEDCGWMMDDLHELGLNPADIKLILLSHEHIDHYGCVQEWKQFFCPSAKVAMTQLGWNNLRAWPHEAMMDDPRPESIDMYLTDGQRVHLGNTTIEIVFTPGHSPGCVSFIIPVRDHSKKHVIGIMGGTKVPNNWSEVLLYWSSVEYFQQKCIEKKCDVGLGVHAGRYEDAFEAIADRLPGDPHPLVIGTERFVTDYIEMYKQMVRDAVPKIKLEHYAPGCR